MPRNRIKKYYDITLHMSDFKQLKKGYTVIKMRDDKGISIKLKDNIKTRRIQKLKAQLRVLENSK